MSVIFGLDHSLRSTGYGIIQVEGRVTRALAQIFGEVYGVDISGEMVRDLMLACVERRFNSLRARHPVQWLADNGSAYVAHETLEFAAALALVPCFTPVRSPESNGVSEAFVKTLKRDYARIQPRPDALTVLQQLPTWIDDYNENHPHSGLRMCSPREFIRSQSQPASCPV